MANSPYSITLIEEGFQINEAGKLENVKVIHYRTTDGDTGTVKVPIPDYSADLVKQLIDYEVAEHLKLRNLK